MLRHLLASGKVLAEKTRENWITKTPYIRSTKAIRPSSFFTTFVILLMNNRLHFRFSIITASLASIFWSILTHGVAYAQAPAFDFAVRGSGVGNYPDASANRNITDAAGNTYVVGVFEGTLTLGSIALTSTSTSTNTFVAKIGPLGNYLWAVQAGGTNGRTDSFGMARDLAGNLFITGCYNSSTATFGGIALTNTTTQSREVFAAKLSPTGQWLWAVNAGGTDEDYGQGIATDVAGNAYVTGTFRSNANFGSTVLTSAGMDDVFVAKLNSAGQWQWAVRGGGGSNDESNDVATDAAGNSYITGNFRSTTATFGSSALTNASTANNSDDIFVAKLTTNGGWLWATRAGGAGSSGFGTGIPGDDWSRRVRVDASGNAYITGSFYSASAGFDNIMLANAAPPNTNAIYATGDVFVAKINSVGQFVWATKAGGNSFENANSLSLGADGYIYCSGNYTSDASTVFFGNTLLPDAIGHDVYVACLDSVGNWQWALSAGGNEQDGANDVSSNGVNGIAVCGYFDSPTINFGPFVLTRSAGQSAFGYQTLFVAHLQGGQPSTLRTLSPATVTVGAIAQLLTVTGTGFAPNSVVRFRGQALPTSFVSATQLTAAVPATVLASAGRYEVVVTTPFDRGGSATAPVQFVVQSGLATHNSMSGTAQLVVYPNPSHGSFTVLLRTASAPADPVTIEVNNMLGQRVATQFLNDSSASGSDHRFSFFGLVPGIYNMRLNANGQTFTQKLVVN